MKKERKQKLSELRAKWAIKKEQSVQLENAIAVLAYSSLDDISALKSANKILNANIGL